MRGYETRIWKDVITMLVTRGMAAVLQSSVEWVELSSEMKVYYLASPEEVLDKREGLEVVVSHDGVEDPLVVWNRFFHSVDIDHGLKYEELSEVFESEMCPLGQFCEAGRRSLGRMR